MLRGSSSWRIQFLKDPALQGGSGIQRMPFLEDPGVSESSSGSAWLLEEDAALSSPMLSQPVAGLPRVWSRSHRCSEARAPGGMGLQAVPCRAPPRPSRPHLAAPANAQPRQRWLYRLREDEEGEGLALQEQLGASTSPHWEYLLSSVLHHPAYPQCSLSCSFKIFSSFFAIFFLILLFL